MFWTNSSNFCSAVHLCSATRFHFFHSQCNLRLIEGNDMLLPDWSSKKFMLWKLANVYPGILGREKFIHFKKLYWAKQLSSSFQEVDRVPAWLGGSRPVCTWSRSLIVRLSNWHDRTTPQRKLIADEDKYKYPAVEAAETQVVDEDKYLNTNTCIQKQIQIPSSESSRNLSSRWRQIH